MDESQGTKTQAPSKTLTAQCYCKAVHFNITVPTSALPLTTYVCHCSICRYTHGTLCVFHAPLPSGVAPSFIAPSSPESLTEYRPEGATSARYFCSTCACHIGNKGMPNAPDVWAISTSIFDANKDDEPSAWDISTHVFTASAPGGGLYDWLPRMAGKEMQVWNPPGAEASLPPRETDAEGRDALRAQCHCGGVSFTIARPDPANESYAPWVSKAQPDKWMAGLDVCGDCRRQTGSHVATWAMVPESCVSADLGRDLEFGTGRRYQSSETTLRLNCGTCGAIVMGFYTGPGGGGRLMESGERIVAVGVGILRAPGGALAEDWLEYKSAGGVGQVEGGRAYDAVLVDSLVEGVNEWIKKRDGSS